jgi:nitric oxide reductase NorD protein
VGGPTDCWSTHTPSANTKQLEYLASAVAGRKLHVTEVRGPHSYTDGTTLFLARTEAGVPRHEEVLTVCVQAAIAGIGSLDSAELRRILGRPEIVRRYVTLEARRAVAVQGHVVPPHVADRICRHWDGDLPRDPDASALMACQDSSVPEAPAVFGSILRRAVPKLSAAPLRRSDLDDDASTAEPEPELDDDEDSGQKKKSDSSAIIAAPFENPMTKLMQSLLGGKSQADEDDGGGDSGVKSAVAPKALPSQHARVVRGVPPKVKAREPSGAGFSYPEWDFRAGAYRPEWCRVLPLDPAPRPDLEPAVHRTDRELARGVIKLALTYERHNREIIGDALDLAALVDFEVTRSAGESPNGSVFQARKRTANDLSALVLLDCSGSGAEASGGIPIWEQERQVAIDLVGAFEHAGVRVALHAFNSHGRQVRFLRVKTFEDRLGLKARKRLAALEPAGFTRMGAAIRHARHVLDRQGGTTRKLLIVISDGLPYDDDYEGDYSERDTARALEEAAAAGVGCACFTVASSTTSEALGRVWGSATHARLPSGRKWAQPIAPALRATMTQASRQTTGRTR